MPGAIAASLHEGSRSEYLAQYVFSSWGTAIAIPHQEDSGVDLFCTLVEKKGRRAWAKSPYTVQVKSTMDAWNFEGEDEIKWLIEHPLPLFLCVVDKKKAGLRVYQTSPRFHVWANGSLPKQLSLKPTDDTKGQCPEWNIGKTVSLRAPILDFSIEDTLDGRFVAKATRVIQAWIDVDCKNLDLKRTGTYNFYVPFSYEPNALPGATTRVEFTRQVTKAELKNALDSFKDPLNFLSGELCKEKDVYGATLSLLLHRHLYPREPHSHMNQIDSELALEVSNSHVGVERLERVIKEALEQKRTEKGGQKRGSLI